MKPRSGGAALSERPAIQAAITKPTPAEIAKHIKALFVAHRERKAAEATESAEKAWFKDRVKYSHIWQSGLMVVELVVKVRNQLDKNKVAQALDGPTGKKFLACYTAMDVTECQVYEQAKEAG